MNDDNNRNSNEEKDTSLTLTSTMKAPIEERVLFAGYSIPAWSDYPDCQYGFDIIKKGVFMESMSICNQPLHLVGRNADVCDIIPEHPSLSRVHAVVQLGKEGRIEVMDFRSTHGTFINGEQLKPFTFNRLYVGDFVQFGGSQRMYTLTGPEIYMREEKKIELKEEDRRRKEEKKIEEKKIKTPKIKIKFLGERSTGMNESLQHQLQEGTWGFDDDATEEDQNASILGSRFDTSDLTDAEKRQYDKIVSMREKRDRCSLNKKWSSDGKNYSESVSELTDQIDEVEQSLYDNVEKRRYKERHILGVKERHQEEEDDYFDRTTKKSQSTAKISIESREILQEKLIYKKKQISYYKQQMKTNQQFDNVEVSEDPLDAFMNENTIKLKNMKESMLKEKIHIINDEITMIISQLENHKMQPPSVTNALTPSIDVLRISSNKSIPEQSSPIQTMSEISQESEKPKEMVISKIDTSEYRVVDEQPRSSSTSSSSSSYLSSFSSVMETLKSGNNRSYDKSKSTVVVTNEAPVAMTVERDPSKARLSRYRRRQIELEGALAADNPVEKRRDMGEYFVPKDMNVAVNKDALDEVVQEMGEHQPMFMKRIIEQLKGKCIVC